MDKVKRKKVTAAILRFDDAVKAGAKVRTKVLSNGRYVRIAILNGKVYRGHVKIKKRGT